MTMQTIRIALTEADRCAHAGDIEGMRFFINEAHCRLAALAPVAGQAAHLASVMDAYELTSKHAHLGDFHA